VGKGSKPSIDETPEQRELAKIAAERYDYFERELKPVQQVYIDHALDANKASNYHRLAGTVKANTSSMLNEHLNGAESGMKAAGIDPTSGRYSATLGDAANAAGDVSADTVNRAQSQQQDNFMAGIGNVIAMGEKKATSAIDGLTDVAAKSADHAQQAVSAKMQRRSDAQTGLATLGTVGLDTAYQASKKPQGA